MKSFLNAVHFVIALTLFGATASTTSTAFAENWPQFRGQAGDGKATSALPLNWNETTNVLWKQTIAGEGWSCPVVWGEKVFVTTAVPTGETAKTEEAEAADDSRQQPPYRGGRGGRQRNGGADKIYRWEVLCLDAKSGKELWRTTAKEGKPPIPRHGSNTYATETPIVDGERVYAYFGMVGLFCYDLSGKEIWKKDLGSYEMRGGWGTGSSPVLFEDKLYLQIDNEQQSFLTALNAKSGEEIWRVKRDEPSQYSSPIVWQNSKRDELVTGGEITRAYHPDNGELLWQLNMKKGRSSATPLAVGDRLYVGTELRDRDGSDTGGGYLFAVKAGGSGDISPAEGKTTSDFVEWTLDRSGIQMASPVYCEGHIYLLERRSAVIHCVNAETGEKVYRDRIPRASAFWASPWTDGKNVYCLDDGGTTHVLAGGAELKVLAANVIDAQTWSSPAIANGKVFLRTANSLYCIGSESAE